MAPKKLNFMRESRLNPDTRAKVQQSCNILLSESIVPLRRFKTYLPSNWDTPLFLTSSIVRNAFQSIGSQRDGPLETVDVPDLNPEEDGDENHAEHAKFSKPNDWAKDYRHVGKWTL